MKLSLKGLKFGMEMNNQKGEFNLDEIEIEMTPDEMATYLGTIKSMLKDFKELTNK